MDSLLDLLGSHPIDKRVEGWRDDMMEDIEQDGHVRGHFLFYHKHEDKNQEDGAEEEDQGEVGATCA